MIGIYKITNKINNKVYIGQSINIEERWKNHRTSPFNGNASSYNTAFYRAIRKYGLENFSFEVIEECEKDSLNEREKYWINEYNSFNPNFGYNLTQGGDAIGHFMKLDYNSLNEIKDLLKNSKIMLKDIAEKYNVSLITLTDINQGHCWKNDNEIYPLRKTKQGKYCIDCGKEISLDAIRCVDCWNKSQQKVERPLRNELKILIRTTSFTQIGKKYGVSDNAVRKWCKIYNLPYRKKDIENYSDEEWNNI